jgi:hypothetical protein
MIGREKSMKLSRGVYFGILNLRIDCFSGNRSLKYLTAGDLFGGEGDREASLAERGNESVPLSGLQTEFVERTREKEISGEPSTRHGIELVRLRASLFQARLSIDRLSSVFL